MFTTTLNRLRRRHNDGLSRRDNDDSGLTLSEPIIVILLLVLFGGIAVAAIVFFQRQGQTTVARANLEAAVLAAETTHNFSSNSSFGTTTEAIRSMGRVTPDIVFLPHNSTVSHTQGHNGPTGLTINAAGVADSSGSAGPPGPEYVFVEVNDAAIDRKQSDNAATCGSTDDCEKVAVGDAILLQIRAENGDTYCAVVVAESRLIGSTAEASLAGTRYDADQETEGPATCGGTAFDATATVLALTRTIPDISG